MRGDLITVEQLARAYGVPAVDYGRPGNGLLITSGAGGMLAGMDAVTVARWCVSSEGLPAQAPANWLAFAEAAAFLVPVAAAYCMFGMDLPHPVRQVLSRFPPARVCWYANADLGDGTACRSLDDLGATAALIAGAAA